LDVNRGYAEEIEKELKKMNLAVDIMFANESMGLADLIAKLCQEGTLFTLVVGSHNPSHRSVTAHVLKDSSKAEGKRL